MRRTTSPLSNELLAYSPSHAGIVIGVSQRAIYQKIASGELQSYKDGKRRLIPLAELQSYVAKKTAEGASA